MIQSIDHWTWHPACSRGVGSEMQAAQGTPPYQPCAVAAGLVWIGLCRSQYTGPLGWGTMCSIRVPGPSVTCSQSSPACSVYWPQGSLYMQHTGPVWDTCFSQYTGWTWHCMQHGEVFRTYAICGTPDKPPVLPVAPSPSCLPWAACTPHAR